MRKFDIGPKGETLDENGRPIYDADGNMLESSEGPVARLMRLVENDPTAKRIIKESIQQVEAREALKESFRKVHPEWTEKQVKIAAAGREGYHLVESEDAIPAPTRPTGEPVTVFDVQGVLMRLKFPLSKAQILSKLESIAVPESILKAVGRIKDEAYQQAQEVISQLQVK